MGNMFLRRPRLSDAAAKSEHKTSRPTSPVKLPAQVTSRAITPPLPMKRDKRDSMSPLHSVESTPKTSFDAESLPLSVSRINFADETLPEYEGMYAVVIDNVLSRSECAELLRDAERSAGSSGWEQAMVNTGNGQQALYTDTRKCGRIIWDSQATIDRVWDRISDAPELQEILRLEDNAEVTGNGPARRNEVWEFTRPNERLRLLKYQEGDYFRPHCDGTYETPDRKERSYYTMQLYLNDQGPPSPEALRELPRDERKAAQKTYLQGGNTAFHSYDGKRVFKVAPKAGSVLIFQHRNLLHSGTDVLHGTKYTVRTDLMYKKA